MGASQIWGFGGLRDLPLILVPPRLPRQQKAAETEEGTVQIQEGEGGTPKLGSGGDLGGFGESWGVLGGS